MSHLNQSLHSLEEDHLQKPYIMSVLATLRGFKGIPASFIEQASQPWPNKTLTRYCKHVQHPNSLQHGN